jgi:Protein of unknown function (DUF3800)
MPPDGLLIVITDAPDIYPVYVDESYGPDHPALCVAGYIFTPEKAKEMSRLWADVLAAKALPYFHMSECNGGYGVFSHLDDAECDVVARRVIALTRDYAEYGFGISVSERDYGEIFPDAVRAQAGTAYTFCLRQCLTMTRRWAQAADFKGRFAFFFENGHQHVDEARKVIADYERETIVDRFQFHSSTFIDKQDAEPLQSADILAWHFYVNYRRVAAGKPSRQDFIALLREQDSTLELTRSRLCEMAPKLIKGLGLTRPFFEGEGSSGAIPS